MAGEPHCINRWPFSIQNSHFSCSKNPPTPHACNPPRNASFRSPKRRRELQLCVYPRMSPPPPPPNQTSTTSSSRCQYRRLLLPSSTSPYSPRLVRYPKPLPALPNRPTKATKMTNPQAARRSLRVSPSYLLSPKLRDDHDSFLDDIATWGCEEGFATYKERSKKHKGEVVKIELRCDRANKRKKRGHIRKTTSSKIASNCPWKVVLRRRVADGNKWSLSVKRLDHIGHLQSSD